MTESVSQARMSASKQGSTMELDKQPIPEEDSEAQQDPESACEIFGLLQFLGCIFSSIGKDCERAHNSM